MLPFFVTVPHSGEEIPPEVTWLQGLSEPHLMRDVDRYVDLLYTPIIKELKLPHIFTRWHRYVVDLNRRESDFDQGSVVGAIDPVGTHPKGLHWSITTMNEALIAEPMSMDLHKSLVEAYYRPFHNQTKELGGSLKTNEVFHLDLHSMPSVGTELHPDPGERRADIVVSDFHGKSSRKDFVELVIKAYKDVGFNVAYNWPYVGGGITQMYGRPDDGYHTVQIELNRDLYMDEVSKKVIDEKFAATQLRVCRALEAIHTELKGLL